MLSMIGLYLVVISAGVLFWSRYWRVNIGFLYLLFLGLFLMYLDVWPPEQAAIKWIAGWMAASILAVTHQRGGVLEEEDAGSIFRFGLLALIVLVSWSSAPGLPVWISGIDTNMGLAGMLLTISGLVRTGIVRRPLEVVLSLLIGFAGFELIFSALSSSVLLTALISIGGLGLALAGAYLHEGSSESTDEVVL